MSGHHIGPTGKWWTDRIMKIAGLCVSRIAATAPVVRHMRRRLPNGDHIVLAYASYPRPEDDPVYFYWHNIFRVDKNHNVVWQVKRIEPAGWDTDKLRKAGLKNFFFTSFRPYDGGYYISSPPHEGEYEESKEFRKRCEIIRNWPTTKEYRPGCKLIAVAMGGPHYDLDPETGIATWRNECGEK